MKVTIRANKKIVSSGKLSKKIGREEYIRHLVIARIKAFPDNLNLVVGSVSGEKEYTKEEMIENIKSGTEIGQEIINAEIEFLRDMAEGKIYRCE